MITHKPIVDLFFYTFGIICILHVIPDSKIHGANMGPIWVRQGPGGPHVGPMNFAIWDDSWDIIATV